MIRFGWVLVGIVYVLLVVALALSQEAPIREATPNQAVQRGPPPCDPEKYQCEKIPGGVVVCDNIAQWQDLDRSPERDYAYKLKAYEEQRHCFTVLEPVEVEVHSSPFIRFAPRAAMVIFPEDRLVKWSDGKVPGYFVEVDAVLPPPKVKS